MSRFEHASTYSCRQSTRWLDFPSHRQLTCLKEQDLEQNRQGRQKHSVSNKRGLLMQSNPDLPKAQCPFHPLIVMHHFEIPRSICHSAPVKEKHGIVRVMARYFSWCTHNHCYFKPLLCLNPKSQKWNLINNLLAITFLTMSMSSTVQYAA